VLRKLNPETLHRQFKAKVAVAAASVGIALVRAAAARRNLVRSQKAAAPP